MNIPSVEQGVIAIILKRSSTDASSVGPTALQPLHQHLSSIAKRGITVAPRQHLQKQGSQAPAVYLLRSGWLACSITLKSGARQIVNVHLPGDIVGLANLGRATAVNGIQAITEAKLSLIEPTAIGRLFIDNPRAAAELYLCVQVDQANSMRQLATMGRANALGRIAGLILQMLQRVGAAPSSGVIEFDVPLIQDDVADLIGLTNVHVNRVVRQLRESGVASWAHRHIVIYDLPALHRIADFSPEGVRDMSWFPEEGSGA